MVPWLALPPCTLFAKFVTDRLVAREWSLTNVRKLIQSCCFLGQNLALFCMCHTNNFSIILFCMTVIIGNSHFYPMNYNENNFKKIFQVEQVFTTQLLLLIHKT